MFDQFNTTVRRGPDRIDVHEHRAPTEESIQLAEKYRRQMEEKWIASYRLQNNVFSGAWDVFREDFGRKIRFIGKFLLNDQSITVNFEVDYFDYKTEGIENLTSKLREKVISEVAGILTLELFRNPANLALNFSK